MQHPGAGGNSTLDELLADPMAARKLPREEAARLLLALAPVVEGLRLASLAPEPAQVFAPAPNGDTPTLLTPVQVAAILGKSRQSVYALLRRPDLAPHVRRINARTLRVEEAGLSRWLSRQSR
jgi:predicted DNA-binding transcriptional regulator AlpA